MNMPIIIHTPYRINPTTFFDKLSKGSKCIKYYNKHYIPYQCVNVHLNHKIIDGKFMFPLWNVLERNFLSREVNFTYTYIKGTNFLLEYNPISLHNYTVFSSNVIYTNSIRASENITSNNSFLLFPIENSVADFLISNKLI